MWGFSPSVEEKSVFDLDVEDSIVLLGVSAYLTAHDGWRRLPGEFAPPTLKKLRLIRLGVSSANKKKTIHLTHPV